MNTLQQASSTALRFLSHRPRTEAEMRTRLGRRFAASIVDQTVARLKDQGLLDDAVFAKRWREQRDRNNPRSSWAISRELVDKGVDKETAASAVEGLDDSASAYRVGEKFANRMGRVDYETFRRRLWGALHRRGYGASVARQVVERLWDTHGTADADLIAEERGSEDG